MFVTGFLFYYFFYFFLIALGLYCCTLAFPSCGEQGLLCAKHKLWVHRLSTWGSQALTQAQQLWPVGFIGFCFFFFISFIYLWLHWVFVAACFLQLQQMGACSLIAVHELLIVVASLVVENGLQCLWYVGLIALCHLESAWTRDQTHISSFGRQLLLTTGPPGESGFDFYKVV